MFAGRSCLSIPQIPQSASERHLSGCFALPLIDMEGASRGISHPPPPPERQPGPPATKRQKVAIACDVCRAKKVKVSRNKQRFGFVFNLTVLKCDGVRPVCSPCARRSDRGVPCEYTSEVRTSHGPSKGYGMCISNCKLDLPVAKHACVKQANNIILVHHLELKLRELQAEKGQSSSVNHQRSDPGTFQAINHARPFESSWSPPSTQHTEVTRPPSAPKTHAAQRMSNGSGSYDAASQQQRSPRPRQNSSLLKESAQRPLVFKRGGPRNIQPMHSGPDYEHSEFFGSKSAGSFVQQIRAAISAKGNTPSPGQNTPVVSGSPLPQLPTLQPKRQNGPRVDYDLPSRKTADCLLDVYWNAVYPLYPFLDRRQFQYLYEGIWAGDPSESDESLMMCTLNVVFALASQFSDVLAPKERESSARKYFDRAQDLLNLDLWDIGSVQLVQCLLLMGQYLQSTNSPHQAWMVTGLTVRIAEGLGLHLPETSARIDDMHQKELVRRLWHGCVVMDR
jgi:Fungal specific transcription factor domain